MSSLVRFTPDMDPLGPAVITIGVFDGVHRGHRELIRATRKDALRRGVLSAIITFDTDPERVVAPERATPRLLDDESRITLLRETGADAVLVVPFDEHVRGCAPERFLDEMVARAFDPKAIHVGAGFRFGARGSGDTDTLYVWAARHDVDVTVHPLVIADGEAVTSTRIRSLVAAGDVRAAFELLDRAHALHGTVHEGRGHGRLLGFPTANLAVDPGAALPATGVYAGRAVLSDGTSWPAAIVVGRPPTFPEATDALEVHLIGFSGDLVGRQLTVEFVERLREQRAFTSMHALQEAIAADVRRVAEVMDVGISERAAYLDEDGVPFVEDPLALEAAERAVAALPDVQLGSYESYDPSWVPVFGPVRLSTLFRDGGASAALITGPLADADLPYIWDPFPPAAAQTARPDFNWLREFTLLVPPDREDEARRLLAAILR